MEVVEHQIIEKGNQLEPSLVEDLGFSGASAGSIEYLTDRENDPTKVLINENISTFINESFSKKGFITSEKWDQDLNIQAQVVNYNDEYVECDCLMDKENLHFELRSFPRFIFDRIENLKKKPFVIINIKSKIGSIRFDVYDGEKRVNKKFFDFKSDWEKLDSGDFDKKLTEHIKI